MIQEIESVGSTVIPAHSFMDQYLPAPGVISSRAPTSEEESDAGLGIRYLRQQSVFDVGQTVVIKAGYIVAVEAMEEPIKPFNERVVWGERIGRGEDAAYRS